MPRSSASAFLNSSQFARGLDGFRLRVAAELQPTGIPSLDAILDGGVPRGSIVELCGTASSGRTSLSFSLLAKVTEHQEACAYVDVSDSLDPLSLAAAGVDLQRLLWIRCGGTDTNSPPPQPQQSFSRTQSLPEPQNDRPPFLGNSCNKSRQTKVWQHPREQIRGIEASLPSIMRNSAEAKNATQARKTQLATLSFPKPDETLLLARCAGEQVGIRRQRGRQANDSQEIEENRGRNKNGKLGFTSNSKPWKRLDQALRVTDLLLHSGGWGVVVFDLGNISWVDARRIELSTWFRFRRAIESTPTILLLLGEEPSAKSCSSLVLQCQRKHENWSCINPQNKTAGLATLQGFEVEGKVANSRTGLHPMDSACWTTKTLWTNSF
jgi:hypothetical protein